MVVVEQNTEFYEKIRFEIPCSWPAREPDLIVHHPKEDEFYRVIWVDEQLQSNIELCEDQLRCDGDVYETKMEDGRLMWLHADEWHLYDFSGIYDESKDLYDVISQYVIENLVLGE